MELLRDHQVEVIRSGKLDRYRRTLADLRVDGVDVGTTLLAEGHALPYRPGRAAKQERLREWCGPSAALPDIKQPRRATSCPRTTRPTPTWWVPPAPCLSPELEWSKQ